MQIWIMQLTNIDHVPLTSLPVLGETRLFLKSEHYMFLCFTIIRSCAAFTLKFINKAGFESFRSVIYNSKTFLKHEICFQYQSQFTKLKTFTHTFGGSSYCDDIFFSDIFLSWFLNHYIVNNNWDAFVNKLC